MPTKSSLLWFIWLSCAKAKHCPKSCTQIMGASVENDGTVWPIKLDKLYSIYMYILDLSICLLWVCVRGLVWAHFKVHLAWRWHAMHHALYTHEWTVRILLGGAYTRWQFSLDTCGSTKWRNLFCVSVAKCQICQLICMARIQACTQDRSQACAGYALPGPLLSKQK